MPAKPKAAHLAKGEQAEGKALEFLQRQGLKWECSNYRCQYGELDLVMRDGSALVVVEVRYRASDHFGGATASVTRQKQARIVAATQQYVIIRKQTQMAVRFDVVAITGDNEIQWIKNAFQT